MFEFYVSDRARVYLQYLNLIPWITIAFKRHDLWCWVPKLFPAAWFRPQSGPQKQDQGMPGHSGRFPWRIAMIRSRTRRNPRTFSSSAAWDTKFLTSNTRFLTSIQQNFMDRTDQLVVHEYFQHPLDKVQLACSVSCCGRTATLEQQLVLQVELIHGEENYKVYRGTLHSIDQPGQQPTSN